MLLNLEVVKGDAFLTYRHLSHTVLDPTDLPTGDVPFCFDQLDGKPGPLTLSASCGCVLIHFRLLGHSENAFRFTNATVSFTFVDVLMRGLQLDDLS